MTEELLIKCKLLVKNREILKSDFQWASTDMIPLCALIYSLNGKTVDAVCLDECKQLVKKNASVLNRYKGDAFYPLASVLALEMNVEKEFSKKLEVYEELKKEYSYMSVLPMIAFLQTEDGVNKAKELINSLDSSEEEEEVTLLTAFYAKKQYVATPRIKNVLQIASKHIEDENEYITKVIELAKYLKHQKGFGSVELSTTERLLYAMVMIIYDDCEEKERQEIFLNIAAPLLERAVQA